MEKIEMAEISLTEREIGAALNVLRSGALRQGKECAAFEEEFADKVGSRYAVTCANGSAALHLAFMAFLEPGDEVLVPSFTFIATASMVTMVNGTPVFCDVDEKTFLIDLKDAEEKITQRTKAIAPVHLFGNPCNIDQVTLFAKSNGLTIVWDAAQAHGATIGGRDVGSVDDFVCYSFYPSKNMFVGEGGMVCTNSHDLYEKIKFMRSHGQTGKYYHTMIGLNYRMTDMEAAIGRAQLKRLDEMLTVRRRNAFLLTEGLADLPGIELQELTENSEHAWHQYCITVDPGKYGKDRNMLASDLESLGIATGVHYPRGLHQQPIFERIYGKLSLPTTEKLSEQILAVPVHHGLEQYDVDRIIQGIRSGYWI